MQPGDQGARALPRITPISGTVTHAPDAHPATHEYDGAAYAVAVGVRIGVAIAIAIGAYGKASLDRLSHDR